MLDWFDSRDFANGLVTEFIAMTIEIAVIVRILEWFRRREANRVLRPYRDSARNSLLQTLARLKGLLEEASVFVASYTKEVSQQVDQISLSAAPPRQNPFVAIREIAGTLRLEMAEKHHLLDVGFVEVGHAVMNWLSYLLKQYAAQVLAEPRIGRSWTYIGSAILAASMRELPIAIKGASNAFFHANTALLIANSGYVRNAERELHAAAREMRKLLKDIEGAA